jgi:chemotaxis protein CheX
MDERITKPFVDATLKVLETMAFIKPAVGAPALWDTCMPLGEVVGVVGLSNEDENIKGFLAIGFSESSIIQIVSNMLGEEYTTIVNEVKEAAGEIANMISGQSRQALSSMGIKLQASLPSVISGKDMTMDGSEKRPLMIVPFTIEKGSFMLGLCMEGVRIK